MSSFLSSYIHQVTYGVIFGISFYFFLIWFSYDKGDTAKQTTCKLFIGIIMFNLICIIAFNNMALASGFSIACTLIHTKMFPRNIRRKQNIHFL